VTIIAKTAGGNPRKQKNTEGLILVRDAHEAIIDRDLWDRVQAKLKARRDAHSFPRLRSYLLTGLLYCGACGGRMHGSTSKRRNGRGADYTRYQCSKFISTGGCGFNSIREDRLLPVLISKLQKDYLAPGKLEDLRSELRRQLIAKREASPERSEAVRQKIDHLDEEIKQGARNLVRASDHFDLLSEELSNLRQRRERLARDLTALEATQAFPTDEMKKVNQAISALYSLRQRLQKANRDQLRAVLRELVSRIDLYFESEQKQHKRWYRFTKGVVRLRPQVTVSSSVGHVIAC
jgi:site-specific DNA recombinase